MLKKYIIALMVILVVVFCYLYSFKAPFIYDDLKAIMGNYEIRSFNPVKIFAAYPNRSVSDITFSLNYYFNRLEPFWYHVVNISIHILNGFVLFILLKKISGFNSKNSLFASLVFLLHPVNVESVTYISSRFGMLSALFMLLGLVFLVDSKHFISLLFFSLSAFSKEWGLVFPFLIIAYLYVYKKPADKSEWFGFWKRLFFPSLLWLSIFLLRKFQGGTFLNKELPRDYYEHILTHINASLEYLRLLLFPLNLNVDHDFPDVLKPDFLMIAGLLLIIGIACLIISNRASKIVRFSLLLYSISFFPVVFVVLSDILVERWLYVPSMAFSILTAFTIEKAEGVFRKTNGRCIIVSGFCLMVLLSFFLLTFKRNSLWVDETLLWGDSINKSPFKARPYNNLGVGLLSKGDVINAEKIFLKAIELDKTGYIPYSNLGLIYGGRKEYDKSERMLKKSIELKPNIAYAHNNLGNVYKELGNFKAAYKEYAKAIELDKNYADAHGNLALLYEINGNSDLVIKELETAFRIEPNKYNWLNRLGIFYLETGKLKDALDTFDKGTRLFPDNPEIRNNKGIVYMRLGDKEMALKEFDIALKNAPAFLNALLNKGTALKELGRFDEAIDCFLAANRVKGSLPEVKFNIGLNYYLKGLYVESERWFNELLLLNPSSFEAYEYLGRIESFQGNKSKAIEHLEKAVSLGNTKKDIIDKLNTLKNR